MKFLNYIYITKRAAIEAGLTHEGTLFGVPAWFADDAEGELAMATPKAPVLHAWCMLADMFYEALSWFTPADHALVSPIHVTGRIQ